VSRTEQVTPINLREGDLIDLIPLFDATDEPVDEGDRLFAECELATVEEVEYAEPWRKDPSQRLVTIYNDQCNIAVPERHLVTRTVN
jgi:hypothetical protein